MPKKIAIFLMLGINLLAKAQVGSTDSLMRLLAASRADTSRVIILLHIANNYETNNQDSAEAYLEKARVLSGSLNFPKGFYLYYEQATIVAFTKGDYDRALDLTEKGIQQARVLKDSGKVLNMINNLSIVYAYKGDMQSQLRYTLEVRARVEEMKDSSKLGNVYHGLANVYLGLKQYRKATDFALLSVKFKKKFKRLDNYFNRVCATAGQGYEGLKMYDSALYYYKLGITESEQSGDQYAEGTIYGYLCNLYAGKDQFAEMLSAADKSLAISRQLQSRQMVASSLYNVAYANFFNGNNAKAKTDIHEALEIALKDSLRDELKNIYIVLSYIAARDGDFAASLAARSSTDSLQEIVLNEQVVNSVSEMEKKYETEKKDKQIKLQDAKLEKRRIVTIILIALLMLTGIIGVLLFRNYRQEKKLREQRISELENEKQLASTEAVLKGEEQERTRLAKDLHDGLGGMMSGIKYSLQTMKKNLIMTPDNQQAFERSMDMLDSSISELRRVAHNMMPEALVKFGLDTALKDFCADVNRSGALEVNYQSLGMDSQEIDQTTAITIYRVIQELINNTMKHAAAKSAIVQVTRENDIISVTVEDDGKGFDPLILQPQAEQGMGWSNIRSRVGYLKGKLDVRSDTGKGTSVHIELNV